MYLFQRIRLLFVPSPKWGPALPQHREEAAEVHKQHGTTMGGNVNISSVYNNEQPTTEMDTKYAPLKSVDKEGQLQGQTSV